MRLKRAVLWTIFYIGLALAFAAGLYVFRGPETATSFLAGYVLEKSLSIDNLMVFTAIFSYFGIATEYRPKVLYAGIIGAILFRAVFVGLGSGALLLAGPYVGIVFGVMVLWSAWKMAMSGGDEAEQIDYDAQWYVKLAKKVFPIFTGVMSINGEFQQPFFVRVWRNYVNGDGAMLIHATPLFLCLIAIEISDIMFSFDSLPVVIAVVQEPFIVYSAVMFAVLGLRSMYFVLEAMLKYLAYLGAAVIVILVFVGTKLLLHSIAELTGANIDFLNVSPPENLGIVLGCLAVGILFSLYPKSKNAPLDR